jgi:hypothetical protein
MDSAQESPCLSVASKKEGRRDGRAERGVVVGLNAHLTGTALQDDIDSTTRRMQQLGADILNSSTPNFQGEDYASKNPYSPRADPPGP